MGWMDWHRGCHRLTSPRIESPSLVSVNMLTCKGLMFPEVHNSPNLQTVLVPEGCRVEWHHRRKSGQTSASSISFPLIIPNDLSFLSSIPLGVPHIQSPPLHLLMISCLWIESCFAKITTTFWECPGMLTFIRSPNITALYILSV